MGVDCGGADSASVARVRCAWRKFKVVRDLDENGVRKV